MAATYTPEQLDAAARADLLSDAEASERQAETGPYFPERGITRESLLEYAAKCRREAGEPDPHARALGDGRPPREGI